MMTTEVKIDPEGKRSFTGKSYELDNRTLQNVLDEGLAISVMSHRGVLNIFI